MFLKVRSLKLVHRTTFLLQALRDNLFPYLFQLLQTDRISGLKTPSSILKESSVNFSLFFDLLPSPYKEACNYVRPTLIIQAHHPISRTLTELHLWHFFCQVKQHIHRFWGLGHGPLPGDIIQWEQWGCCENEICWALTSGPGTL